MQCIGEGEGVLRGQTYSEFFVWESKSSSNVEREIEREMRADEQHNWTTPLKVLGTICCSQVLAVVQVPTWCSELSKDVQ